MRYFNQHSFAISTIVIIGLAALALLYDGVKRRDLIALGALVLAFGGTFLFLRPGPSTVTEAAAVEAAIKSGRPTLIEFQSNY
ncbi:MAG: hypothetical protein HY023_04530 [Chloroflexi bacterium]|nr:hypothetical protein [Chloroflexota bacterium]MBI3763196.1 hypothetical protein [Chloroflexota bacterium]